MAKSSRQLLTPEIADALVEAVRANGSLRMASYAIGLSEGTVRTWLFRGRKKGADPILAKLVARVKKATLDWARDHVETITAASRGHVQVKKRRTRKADGETEETVETVSMKGDWQAAAWLLERTLPNDFGRVKRDDEPAKERAPRPQVAIGFNEPEETSDPPKAEAKS